MSLKFCIRNKCPNDYIKCSNSSSVHKTRCGCCNVVKGDKGDKGEPGNTILASSFPPDNSQGVDDNLYLDLETNDIYKKIAGVWVLSTNIQGDKGDPGNNVFAGNGVPNPILGLDGDIYIDADNGDVYEKIAGVWTLQGSIYGDKGEKGDVGDIGDKGDKGEIGDKGDKGDVGDKGAKGDVGDKGDKGDIGEVGDKGDKGDKGIPGDIGEIGDPGDVGDIGDKGDQGEKGDKGDKGTQGIAGDPGDPGDKGDKGDKGDMGENFSISPPVIIQDYTEFDIGTISPTIDLVANDTIVNGVNTLTVINPYPDQGVFNSVGPTTYNFEPAPRFDSTSVFAYSVLDNAGRTGSAIIKANSISTNTQNPLLIYAEGPNINLLNPSTLFTSNLTVTGVLIITGLDGNRNDCLIYYSDSATGNINAFDSITPVTFLLHNLTNASILAYDNLRNYLYVGYNISNGLLTRIAVDPYDRYNTPGVQTFAAVNLTLPAPLNVETILSMTVQQTTGYIYLIANGIGNTLYILNPLPAAPIIINSVAIPQLNPRLSFANDGKIYLIENGVSLDIYEVDQSLLTLTLLSGGVLPGTFINALGLPIYTI